MRALEGTVEDGEGREPCLDLKASHGEVVERVRGNDGKTGD